MTSVDLLRFRVPGRGLVVQVLLLLVALTVSGDSLAGQLKLAWDPVTNATGYRLHYGTSSGNYPSSIDAQTSTSVTVPGLTDGARYFFAVRAYDSATTSGLSNEVSAVVPVPAPVASFTASPTTGFAPLVVTLTDTSSGSISSWSWNLGDGSTASTRTVAKTYSNPGTYAVTLTVMGSGGSTIATQSISVTAVPVTGGGSTTTTGGTTTTTGGTTTTTSGGTTPTTGGSTTPTTGGSTTPTTGGSTTPTTGGSTTPTTGVCPTPTTKGLVAAYGFEEASGSDVIDASGSANHGRISGARRVRTAFFGRALKFDGNDWITIDDSASLDLTKGMTLEAWVYPTARLNSWVTVLLKERSGGLAYSLYANSDVGRPSNTINLGGGNKELNAGPQLPVNTWTHLAATYDGSTQRLYVNGELVGTRPQAGNIFVSTGKLRIGGNSIWGGEFFTGYIDEVRVYNCALTQDGIAADSKTAVVGLLLSKSPDRSNAVPLNGLPVSGTIYVSYVRIFPDAASNPVKQVAFWLDDPNPTSSAPRRIEQQSPFDFGGTAQSGAAAGFDTTGLSKGVHTITAKVTLKDGTILPLVYGTFTIK
jgi:PKD repeat protein